MSLLYTCAVFVVLGVLCRELITSLPCVVALHMLGTPAVAAGHLSIGPPRTGCCSCVFNLYYLINSASISYVCLGITTIVRVGVLDGRVLCMCAKRILCTVCMLCECCNNSVALLRVIFFYSCSLLLIRSVGRRNTIGCSNALFTDIITR